MIPQRKFVVVEYSLFLSSGWLVNRRSIGLNEGLVDVCVFRVLCDNDFRIDY
jgi:hypothetical protein